MKKRYYILLALMTIVIIATIIFIGTRKSKQEEPKQENKIENSENESSNDNTEKIEAIKNEINATADTEIYQVEEEPDGRKILQIKSDVQFEVDLAGIIKNAKPEEEELQTLINKIPETNGVWISNQSRESFLQLLKKNGIENFSINQDSFLQNNTMSNNILGKKLENLIKSDKLYIINMTGMAYERDYISGEIVEYPFEDMDSLQIIEPYQKENKIILEITSNKRQKLTDAEILEAIVQY